MTFDELAGKVHPVEAELLAERPRPRVSKAALLVTILLNGSIVGILLRSTIRIPPPPSRSSVRLFFLAAAPPPPPPPKGTHAESLSTHPRRIKPQARPQAAKPTPEEPIEEAPEGDPEGVDDGVPGGVPGGVLGGILGGTGAVPRVASTDPVLLERVDPDYPAGARERGISGSVLVEALVGTTGSVESVSVIESIPLLDQAAIDAVRRWRFEPATRNGRPVPATIRVKLRFGLAAA